MFRCINDLAAPALGGILLHFKCEPLERGKFGTLSVSFGKRDCFCRSFRNRLFLQAKFSNVGPVCAVRVGCGPVIVFVYFA